MKHAAARSADCETPDGGGRQTRPLSIQTGPGIPAGAWRADHWHRSGSGAHGLHHKQMTPCLTATSASAGAVTRSTTPGWRFAGHVALCGCSASCWTGTPPATSTTNSNGSRAARRGPRLSGATPPLPGSAGTVDSRARPRTGSQPHQHRSAVTPIAGAQGRCGGNELATVPRPAGDAAAVAWRTTTVRAAEPKGPEKAGPPRRAEGRPAAGRGDRRGRRRVAAPCPKGRQMRS